MPAPSWRTWWRWARSRTRTSRTRRSCSTHTRPGKAGTRSNDALAGRSPLAIDAVRRRHLVDHARIAFQLRRGAPRIVAARVAEIPRSILGAVPGRRRRRTGDPGRNRTDAVRRRDAGGDADDFAVVIVPAGRAGKEFFPAAAGGGRRVGRGGTRPRRAMAAQLARGGPDFQGSAGGAGRIAGCAR